MIGLLIAGVVATVGGLSVARGVQVRRKRQGGGSVAARTQMGPLKLVALLETQIRGVVRENTACRAATTSRGESNWKAYKAWLAGRQRRLLVAAAGTAAMIGGMPVFTAGLNAMAAGADDDPVMGKVIKSGEVWPGTTIGIVQYIEKLAL